MIVFQREILEVFKTGRRDAFFKLWEEFLPENIRNEDTVAQKLEFYVHIYYAVYPLKFMPNVCTLFLQKRKILSVLGFIMLSCYWLVGCVLRPINSEVI